MKYMLLLYTDPRYRSEPGTPEAEEVMGRWFAITDEMAKAGVLVAGDALQTTETATTVRAPEGTPVVTDGPFAETREILGGYYLIDVPDLDAATEWAARMPNAERGSVEIRPVMELDRSAA